MKTSFIHALKKTAIKKTRLHSSLFLLIKGFPVVTINSNDASMSPGDSCDEMAKLAKEKKYNFPYLVDETQVSCLA